MIKTSDEIKKGLEEFFVNLHNPTFEQWRDGVYSIPDALSLIQQLEAQNAELLKKVEQLQVERDAAVADLHYALNHPIKMDACQFCNRRDCTHDGTCDAVENDRWQWRGIQKEK